MSEKKNITIIDLARVAKVSKSTVSRVLSGDRYVSNEAAEAVYEAVQQTGYRTNTLARNLRQGKSDLIGAIIPDISNSFFAQIILAAQMTAKKYKLCLMIFNTHESIEEEVEALEILMGLNVYGILLVTAAYQGHTYRVESKIHIPVVFVDRQPHPADLFERSAFVATDDETGGLLAAQKLQERLPDKANILVLKDSRKISNSEARFFAFRNYFTANQVFVEDINLKTLDMKNIPTLCKRHKICAIFCTTEPIAYKAVYTLKKSDFSIPGDIKIIGFDGSDWMDKMEPTLATISQDTKKIGKVAVELLRKLANDDNKILDGKKLSDKKIRPYYILGGSMK